MEKSSRSRLRLNLFTQVVARQLKDSSFQILEALTGNALSATTRDVRTAKQQFVRPYPDITPHRRRLPPLGHNSLFTRGRMKPPGQNPLGHNPPLKHLVTFCTERYNQTLCRRYVPF